MKFPATPSLPLSLPPSLTLAELGGDLSVGKGRNYFTRMTEELGSIRFITEEEAMPGGVLCTAWREGVAPKFEELSVS